MVKMQPERQANGQMNPREDTAKRELLVRSFVEQMMVGDINEI
jgi:hypothetical protein